MAAILETPTFEQGRNQLGSYKWTDFKKELSPRLAGRMQPVLGAEMQPRLSFAIPSDTPDQAPLLSQVNDTGLNVEMANGGTPPAGKDFSFQPFGSQNLNTAQKFTRGGQSLIAGNRTSFVRHQWNSLATQRRQSNAQQNGLAY